MDCQAKRNSVIDIILRYLPKADLGGHLPGNQGRTTKTETDLSRFADADKVNSWASEAMHWAAAMIQRFVEKLKK